MKTESQRIAAAEYRKRHYAETDYGLKMRLRAILDRCYNPDGNGYEYYGGRGVVVCEEWQSDPMAFVLWAKQSGFKNGLQIDRINNDGNYEPDNCRWVTCAENNRNKRSSKLTAESVMTIRQMIAEGFTNHEIARKFSVHVTSIHQIKIHKTWL